jgi:hypothetical protein
MNLQLQKFEYFRGADILAEEYTYLSENDKERIINIDSEATFDFEDEHNNYTCYLLIDSSELQKYKKVLDLNLIAYLCNDISQSVIKNQLNLEKILSKYVTPDNERDYYTFMKTVDDWIVSKLDLDLVLDMINEKGMASLRDIDKRFLNQFK